MDKYQLMDPADSRRIRCATFAEMVNTWFLRPSLVMLTVRLDEDEAMAVNNIVGLHDKLRRKGAA